MNAFVDFSLAGLNKSESGVWLVLWRDTKPEGVARTSQVDLARRAGVSDRAVRQAIKSLQAAGLLTVVVRGGLPRRLSSQQAD